MKKRWIFLIILILISYNVVGDCIYIPPVDRTPWNTFSKVNITDKAYYNNSEVCTASNGLCANSSNLTLNQVGNPTANTVFNFANRDFELDFNIGTMFLEQRGAFVNDVLHIHQHTGNPGAGSDLLHLEAEDPDVMIINATGNRDVIAYFNHNVSVEGSKVCTANNGLCNVDNDKSDFILLADSITNTDAAAGEVLNGYETAMNITPYTKCRMQGYYNSAGASTYTMYAKVNVSSSTLSATRTRNFSDTNQALSGVSAGFRNTSWEDVPSWMKTGGDVYIFIAGLGGNGTADPTMRSMKLECI